MFNAHMLAPANEVLLHLDVEDKKRRVLIFIFEYVQALGLWGSSA